MERRSCIYRGHVRHRRLDPVPHAFDYALFMMYLDLDELEGLFRGRLLWSAHRPAVAWFRRADHLGDPARPLDQEVRDLVEGETGRRPKGPVGLLTHLRYFGYCINPVSFYYCFDEAGAAVEFVVAEVNNTPWGERHCYVLGAHGTPGPGGEVRQRVPKAFHVSPFMGMEMEYAFRLTAPGRRLTAHIENRRDGDLLFDATLSLERREIAGRSLAAVLARHPFMTARVATAIYLQALRLWWKGVPFHPHPGRVSPRGPEEER